MLHICINMSYDMGDIIYYNIPGSGSTTGKAKMKFILQKRNLFINSVAHKHYLTRVIWLFYLFVKYAHLNNHYICHLVRLVLIGDNGDMFSETEHWYAVPDGDATARDTFNRHYSRHHYRDNRKPRLFVGPGGKMVLRDNDGTMLFVWRKFISDNGQDGVNCAVFRNESKLRSSDLILEAERLAWSRWPGERLYTYIDVKKIKSVNPGYCFKMAGWSVVRNEDGSPKYTGSGLAILEKYPIQV
jgi:hypothetical protein